MKDLQVIVENSEMSEHSLQELLKFLKLNEPYQELSKILIGERSVGNFAFELLKNGTLEEQEEIFGETITVITDAIKLDQAFYINEMTKAVNLSRQPFYQIKEELSEFVSESYPWYASFTSIMMPSIINVFERSVWTSSSLLVAEIAIKSKIHYLRHGKFPKDLSELVTEKLIDEIPIDPYTGKPLGVTAWKFKY